MPALLYVDLLNAITQYRELLQRAKRRGRVDYLAWITRNLLELRIWSEHCGRSLENADEFFCDAVRDLVDLNRKLGGLEGEALAEMEIAKQFIGSTRPHHRFRPVAEAAEEIGLRDFYEKNCKLLSKYVHPTALSVVAHIRGKGEDTVRQQFFDLGRQFADEAVQKLDSSCLGETYRKYRSTMNRVLARLPEEMRPFPKPV